MSKTVRTIPPRPGYSIWLRKPKYKWKLLEGISRKKFPTDYDDNVVAANHEMRLEKKDASVTGAVKQAKHRKK